MTKQPATAGQILNQSRVTDAKPRHAALFDYLSRGRRAQEAVDKIIADHAAKQPPGKE